MAATHLNTTGFQRTQGLDRMRNTVAISTKVNKIISAEAGYLNQYSFVRSGDDTIDHILTLSLGARF
jgi:hypothetical protein